jgi:hypothetical protein
MTYLTNTSFLTAGVELEFHNKRGQYRSIDQWRTLLSDAGFDWLLVKYDGSANVDVEIVFPPMPAHGAGGAMDDIARLCNLLKPMVARYQKRDVACTFILAIVPSQIYHLLTIGRIQN